MALPILPLIAASLFLLVFGYAAWGASDFNQAARIFPMAIGVVGLVLSVLDIVLDLRTGDVEKVDAPPFRHVALHFGLIAVYLLLFVLIGFPLATGLYAFGFLLLTTANHGKIEWFTSVLLGGAALLVASLLRMLVGGRF